MKDNFSEQAESYARFRPAYPEGLYAFILEPVPARHAAWDCGTGNGQVARRLADSFAVVEANDTSPAQLSHAPAHPRINYTVCPVESTPYPDDHFDLVTVGQALHWFDHEEYFQEVRRVTRPGGVFAAWTYWLVQKEENPAFNEHFERWYHEIVRAYFDTERRHVESMYASINIPFSDMQKKRFDFHVEWSSGDFFGYLSSWSAVRKYIRINGVDPVLELMEKVGKEWPVNEKRRFRFPLQVYRGIIRK